MEEVGCSGEANTGAPWNGCAREPLRAGDLAFPGDARLELDSGYRRGVQVSPACAFTVLRAGKHAALTRRRA